MAALDAPVSALIVLGVFLVTAILVIGWVYLQVTRGAITVVRPERRIIRQLGPIHIQIAAPTRAGLSVSLVPRKGLDLQVDLML